MRKTAIALLIGAALAVSGCANVTTHGGDHSPEEVANATYRHNGPPALTLYTMINNRSGSGAHTSLMINASQRVVFDPAGTVRSPRIIESGDVIYGVTPAFKNFYERAHARETFHVRIQRIEVSAEVAEKALRLARQRGAVASAQCAASTSEILSQLPGFEGIKGTWFPNNLADQFATLPISEDRKLYDNDGDDKTVAIKQFEAAAAQ